MYSFNQALKAEIVAEIIRHREQDQIIQGTYGEGTGDNWKGCAVGCAIHSLNLKKGKDFSVSSHAVYESEFGIPRILAQLEDRIFEGLSVEESKTWPENFMSAVPVDSDLNLVWPKFVVWLLTDKEDGVIKFAKTDNQREVIQKVSDLYTQVIKGVEVSKETWRLAHKNAAYAADATAYAAADAYAAAGTAYAGAYAYATAYAGAYATAYAGAYAATAYAATATAYAAADAAADAYAARRAHFKKMADKLIGILTNG